MNLRDLFFLKSLGGGVKVDTAEVGQTIVVKSIDGEGKPTEWEATDFPPPVTDEHINELIYAALGPIEALVDEINGEVI